MGEGCVRTIKQEKPCFQPHMVGRKDRSGLAEVIRDILVLKHIIVDRKDRSGRPFRDHAGNGFGVLADCIGEHLVSVFELHCS